MDDDAWIARVLDGDRDAFVGLVDRYYGPCARYAVHMLGNRADAEDVLQEVFLRAYRALGRYRPHTSFRAWLFRILVNQCRTAAARRGRRAQRFSGDERALDSAAVDSVEERAVDRDALETALAGLEPLLREAFLLKHGEGLEYREMAALTGASVSALKMRVKRACEALRTRLEEKTGDG